MSITSVVCGLLVLVREWSISLKAQAYSKACAEVPPLADPLLISAGKQVSLAKVGELGHVVGEDGVDPIGDSLDQASQE